MNSALPYLASVINAQSSVLSRHVLEHEFQYNIADVVMIMDDIHGLQSTLKKIEQELRKEQEEIKCGHERI